MTNARILIVEDEWLVAANIEAVLEDQGHQSIGIAADTETALQLAQKKPDLALVDINLRDGPTGPDIAERLYRDHGVPILFVTANPRMSPGLTGAIGVLSKPCGDATVAAAVDYVLKLRQGRRPPAPPAGLTLFEEAA
jgi:CheY-like chemotaxis protein